MPRPWTLLATLLAGSLLGAQDQARMKQMLDYLAGPELAGRGTGETGGTKAATYLAGRMQAMGLQTITGTGMGGETPYHYTYTLSGLAAAPAFQLGATSLLPDLHASFRGGVPQEGGTLFAGYGLEEDLRRLDLKGRWAVVLEGHPGHGEEAQPFRPEATLEAKIARARAAGALGLVLLEASHPAGRGPDYWNRVTPYADRLPRQSDFPVLTLTPEGARLLDRDLLARQAEDAHALGLPLDTPLPGLGITSGPAAAATSAANLVGLVPGTDPALRNEYLLVCGHYDHLGGTSSSYYPGADDNASGTTGLMELAQLLAQSQPKRSLLFVAMSGEEKGLLGSEAFASRCPVSLSSIVGVVNLDMLGRNATRTVYVTPAAVSGQVNTLVKKARELALGKAVDLSKGIDQYWQQSDHYSFAKRGIPVIFFNSGTHADLHLTSDTPGKIDYEKMARIVDLAKDLITHFANTSEKPSTVPSSEYGAWTWPVKGSSTFSLTSQPRSLTVAPGATASFTVAATGGKTPYTYQWLRNGNAIPNATAATYSFTAQAADSGAIFKASVKDASSPAQTLTSQEATLTVSTAAFAITTQPQSVTVTAGASATFTVAATGGTTPYTYQWYRNEAALSGATAATYSLTAQAADSGARFKAVLKDASGRTLTSDTATLTVTAGPVEKLLNGGFEGGTTSWSGTTGAIGAWASSGQPAYEGTRAAWLGGNGRTSTETLYQTVTLPATLTKATLSFYLHIDTKETGSTAYDKLAIQVRNSSGSVLKTLATYSNAQAAAGYQLRSFDVSAHKGTTIRVHFNMTEDASAATNFLVDKVSLAIQ